MGYAAYMEMKSAHILVEEHEQKRPFGRSVCRWEDNNKVDHNEIVSMWTGFT
jgi:hypothetical protein